MWVSEYPPWPLSWHWGYLMTNLIEVYYYALVAVLALSVLTTLSGDEALDLTSSDTPGVM